MSTLNDTLPRDEIQGLVASGFGKQKAADFLLLTVEDPSAAKAWLADLLPRITMSDDKRATVKRCLAFSAPGLVAFGLREESLATFSKEFRQGMVTEHRQRILGDLPDSPSDPRIWTWGGPTTPPVHAALMIYAADRTSCDDAVATERGGMRGVSRAAQALIGQCNGPGALRVRRRPQQPVHSGLPRRAFGDGLPAVSSCSDIPTCQDRRLLAGSAAGALSCRCVGRSRPVSLGRNGVYRLQADRTGRAHLLGQVGPRGRSSGTGSVHARRWPPS